MSTPDKPLTIEELAADFELQIMKAHTDGETAILERKEFVSAINKIVMDILGSNPFPFSGEQRANATNSDDKQVIKLINQSIMWDEQRNRARQYGLGEEK